MHFLTFKFILCSFLRKLSTGKYKVVGTKSQTEFPSLENVNPFLHWRNKKFEVWIFFWPIRTSRCYQLSFSLSVERKHTSQAGRSPKEKQTEQKNSNSHIALEARVWDRERSPNQGGAVRPAGQEPGPVGSRKKHRRLGSWWEQPLMIHLNPSNIRKTFCGGGNIL